MRMILSVVLTILLSFPLSAEGLNVFAAASLSDALKEVSALYEKEGGPKVSFNFAASSLLARQIEEGAPADLFFSADEAKMDALEKKNLIAPGTRVSLLSNALAIVVRKESALALSSPRDLAGPAVEKLALAETETVPAGIYARQYLTGLGLWEQVAPKVVPTENVRAALAAVESGNTDAGIVYVTDAMISKKVRVAFTVPRKEGPKISYPVAVVRESAQAGTAKKFLKFLRAKKSLAIFERYGFIILK